MKPIDKNFRNQILTFLLAAVMLTGAFWGAENGVTTAPPYAWVSDVPAISMQESLQQEANTREPLAEETKTQDETKAETPQDAQGDKQAEDNKNAASEEEPNEEEDTDTGDLKEDAYAKETFSEDALLEEIGLADGKITEIKVITGAGQEETVKNKNGAFGINLSTKNATILQVSYLDGNGNHKVYTKRVKYERPEGSTPAEKMPKIETNLKDGGTYNQQELNFDVWLTDYRGRRLSYSNMEVTANGDAADYIGEMDRQTYSVKLKEGANEIRVLARDVYQYAIVKTWTVYYKAGKGEITISLEGGTVGIPYFIRPQKMEVSDGENLAQVVERFLTQNGYSYRHAGTIKEGFYLSAVKKKGMLAGFSTQARMSLGNLTSRRARAGCTPSTASTPHTASAKPTRRTATSCESALRSPTAKTSAATRRWARPTDRQRTTERNGKHERKNTKHQKRNRKGHQGKGRSHRYRACGDAGRGAYPAGRCPGGRQDHPCPDPKPRIGTGLPAHPVYAGYRTIRHYRLYDVRQGKRKLPLGERRGIL